MNKDVSNINKMLSYINTFVHVVFGSDFLNSITEPESEVLDLKQVDMMLMRRYQCDH